MNAKYIFSLVSLLLLLFFNTACGTESTWDSPPSLRGDISVSINTAYELNQCIVRLTGEVYTYEYEGDEYLGEGDVRSSRWINLTTGGEGWVWRHGDNTWHADVPVALGDNVIDVIVENSFYDTAVATINATHPYSHEPSVHYVLGSGTSAHNAEFKTYIETGGHENISLVVYYGTSPSEMNSTVNADMLSDWRSSQHPDSSHCQIFTGIASGLTKGATYYFQNLFSGPSSSYWLSVDSFSMIVPATISDFTCGAFNIDVTVNPNGYNTTIEFSGLEYVCFFSCFDYYRTNISPGPLELGNGESPVHFNGSAALSDFYYLDVTATNVGGTSTARCYLN
jgi:hypothetical protein